MKLQIEGTQILHWLAGTPSSGPHTPPVVDGEAGAAASGCDKGQRPVAEPLSV